MLHALHALGRPRPESRTREVARDVGLSERRFIEVFKAEVVITPKLFSRVRRFQYALSLIDRNVARANWSMVAAESGYCDQSHLIRDFDRFTGVTPGEYLAQLEHVRKRGASAKPNHLPLVEYGQFCPIRPEGR